MYDGGTSTETGVIGHVETIPAIHSVNFGMSSIPQSQIIPFASLEIKNVYNGTILLSICNHYVKSRMWKCFISLKSKTACTIRNFLNIKIHSSVYRSVSDICIFLVTEKKNSISKFSDWNIKYIIYLDI